MAKVDSEYSDGGPSAAYSFERNRLIALGASPEAAHEAGVKAHLASVWGADAKKDRDGNFIPQGIGSESNPSANHYAAILKYEGREIYEREVRKLFKRDPATAKRLGLPEPPRVGA